MKFSAILGSLAIYGLQVHAIPTDPQPMELGSPVSNTLEARDGYCCVVLKNRQNTIANFIPRGTELYP
ncbi:hypothetical protein E4U11_007604, partial [Claviceps purpurea]